MNKTNQGVPAVAEVLTKKSFWLPKSLGKKVEEETKKGWKSQSALMTHIIVSFFKK